MGIVVKFIVLDPSFVPCQVGAIFLLFSGDKTEGQRGKPLAQDLMTT